MEGESQHPQEHPNWSQKGPVTPDPHSHLPGDCLGLGVWGTVPPHKASSPLGETGLLTAVQGAFLPPLTYNWPFPPGLAQHHRQFWEAEWSTPGITGQRLDWELRLTPGLSSRLSKQEARGLRQSSSSSPVSDLNTLSH